MNELKHLAIIMDGNGRWAKNHGLARVLGHEKGTNTAREITTFAAKNKIERLTLFAFSTENWSRPKSEVNFLMKLLQKFLKEEENSFLEHNIRFETIGDISVFSPKLQEAIISLKEKSKNCTGLTQALALNYGSQDEILRAIKKMKNLSLENFEDALDDKTKVDLLVRTGGEMRLSNFLLWQAAYAELRFTNTLWPDFTVKELEAMIDSFKKSHRRFGGL